LAIVSTEFKADGVTLTVKAIDTDDQKILMTIEPKQSVNSGEKGAGDTPIINS
jgi:hypothetical protein